MNKISVLGRVSQGVETKDFNGRSVANFNIASQNKQKIGDENGKPVYGTNFYRVSAWGQSAETAAKFLKVGHRVGVVGDLVIREYTGKDGLKHTVVEINNAEIDLVETRAEAEAKNNAKESGAVRTAAPVASASPTPAQMGFTPVETDEFPF